MSSAADAFAVQQRKAELRRAIALQKADQRLAAKSGKIRLDTAEKLIQLNKKNVKAREAREKEIEVERKRKEAAGEEERPRSCFTKFLSSLCGCRGGTLED